MDCGTVGGIIRELNRKNKNGSRNPRIPFCSFGGRIGGRHFPGMSGASFVPALEARSQNTHTSGSDHGPDCSGRCALSRSAHGPDRGAGAKGTVSHGYHSKPDNGRFGESRRSERARGKDTAGRRFPSSDKDRFKLSGRHSTKSGIEHSNVSRELLKRGEPARR